MLSGGDFGWLDDDALVGYSVSFVEGVEPVEALERIGVAALGPVFLGSPAAARTNPPQHYNLRRNPCRETQCAARYDLSSTGNA